MLLPPAAAACCLLPSAAAAAAAAAAACCRRLLLLRLLLCGLPADRLLIASQYFNYAGPLIVSGSVAIASSAGTQLLSVRLSGVDPQCANGAGPAANSCGVHIHANPTCDADAGGHYYDTSQVLLDPWTAVG